MVAGLREHYLSAVMQCGLTHRSLAYPRTLGTHRSPWTYRSKISPTMGFISSRPKKESKITSTPMIRCITASSKIKVPAHLKVFRSRI